MVEMIGYLVELLVPGWGKNSLVRVRKCLFCSVFSS